MTTSSTPAAASVEHVVAHHDTVKRLGEWTLANSFAVVARDHSAVHLDLRGPAIVGDIDIEVSIAHSTLTLLLPEDTAFDGDRIAWTGGGKIKDPHPPTATSRTVAVHGDVDSGEIRVKRGGVAILSAMASREFVDDAVRAHREGSSSTVADPTGPRPPKN